jgi:biopolymer transport protein ExbD
LKLSGLIKLCCAFFTIFQRSIYSPEPAIFEGGEISMTNNWILRKEDKLFDPVSLKTLRTWVYENRVQSRDMVSSDGGNTWSLAEKTPELLPFFSSQSPIVSELPTGYVGKVERRQRSIEVIDMIPMIDMVFLLLIFFALTNTFEMQRFLELNLPKGSSGIELKKTEKLTLAINKDNQITLENELIELPELESKLKAVMQGGTKVTLVIKGDENVPHGRVVELMDAANAAGVQKIMVTVSRK